MKTFDDLPFKEHDCAKRSRELNAKGIDLPATLDTQARLDFDNGFGVSVIQGRTAYSGEAAPYELAVFHDGNLHYQNPVAQGDVCGYLTKEDVTARMADIQGFDSDVDAVEAAWDERESDA